MPFLLAQGGAHVTEARYQAQLIRKLKRMFPDAILMKNDSSYIQGIPDWTLLCGCSWAVLEIKASLSARRQPNQEYYITRLSGMSFAAFICPENEKEVLSALQEAFGSPRRACVSQS
jgi:hypothetical protein